VPQEAIEAVLDRMVDVGLVDDEVFARDWVESRQRRRYLSKNALRQELTRKGVEREEIQSALESVDGADELAAARALAEKKGPAMARLEPQVRYRRMAGLLGRRGFSSGVVGRVLSETLSVDADDG
jgi:regulatory protein